MIYQPKNLVNRLHENCLMYLSNFVEVDKANSLLIIPESYNQIIEEQEVSPDKLLTLYSKYYLLNL